MAAYLEAVPQARAVVNFAPILLEQIEDYIAQISAYLTGGGAIRDPLLAELAEPALPGDEQARLRLMQACLRANPERMIARFEPYQRLATMAEWYRNHPPSLVYASNQFLTDLQRQVREILMAFLDADFVPVGGLEINGRRGADEFFTDHTHRKRINVARGRPHCKVGLGIQYGQGSRLTDRDRRGQVRGAKAQRPRWCIEYDQSAIDPRHLTGEHVR